MLGESESLVKHYTRSEAVHDIKGLVFNIQRWAVQDGPGIRTTVFLKGCPLRCEWCSNPESQSSQKELMTRDIRCILCGRCVDVCPSKGAITFMGTSGQSSPQNIRYDTQHGSDRMKEKDNQPNQHLRVIDHDRCAMCLKCAEVCPAKAIVISGELMSVNEVMDIVLRDKSYYRRTNGGLTISGGEVLMQWQFAGELLKEAKEHHLHTALDTTGYRKWEILGCDNPKLIRKQG